MRQTTYDVQAPDSVLGKITGVRSVMVRQTEYEHDLMRVEVYGYAANELRLRTFDPIQASLQHNGYALPFIGYVHNVVPLDQNKEQRRRCIINVMGPSYPLKNARQRAWANVRTTDVVAQIANEYRLTAEIEEHNHVFEMISQPGISDWALLVRLAKRIGYVVFVTGTTLVFRSRGFQIDQRRKSAPGLTFLDRAESSITRSDILSFEPRLGENAPNPEGMKGRRTLAGVDPRTSLMVSNSRTGVSGYAYRPENPAGTFQIYDTDCVALSPSEAATRNEGHEEYARYQHRATALTEGVPRLRQCDEVYLAGLPGDYAGYWSTISVKHRFENDTYRMNLELGTDSMGTPRNGSQPTVIAGSATYVEPRLDKPSRKWVGRNLATPIPQISNPGVVTVRA